MKKIFYILFALAATSGCTDWLSEPRPLGQVEEDDMFALEEGYRNVLIGVYLKMASNDLYGRNMSVVLPELFAQHWEVQAQKMESYAKAFDFENQTLKDAITASWKAYYACIVNLNSLLNAIDSHRDLFSEDNYNLIKGEALGLRAFLHFEVLRMWGPVPIEVESSRQAIPYVLEVTKDPDRLVSDTYLTVVREIWRDLNAAEDLLINDPIHRYSREFLNTPSDAATAIIGDEFYYYRQNRFNYYAVKATKARFFMWIDMKQEAMEAAQEVIGMANWGLAFGLASNDNLLQTNTDLTVPMEHIFAVHNAKMRGTFQDLYKANGLIWQDEPLVTNIYENDPNDTRYRSGRYWQNVTDVLSGKVTYMYKKYINADYSRATEFVPLIRVSEMYFIAMECAAAPEVSGAGTVMSYFSPYMMARSLDANYDWVNLDFNDEASTLERLEKEYHKEFYGEGQMWYFYKRHNYRQFTLPKNYTMVPENYVIPKPDAQSSYE